MSKSNSSDKTPRKAKLIRFGYLTGVLALIVSGLIAFVAQPSFRRPLAKYFVGKAVNASTADRSIQYLEYAAMLTPHDGTIAMREANVYLKVNNITQAINRLEAAPIALAYHKLAELWLEVGESDKAMTALSQIPTIRPDDELLLAKVQMEVGATAEGCGHASKAIDTEGDGGARITALCYLVVTNIAGYAKAIGSINAPQALQSLQNANASKYYLASELYASGLVRSAQRVLDTSNGKSSAEWLLWTHIRATLTQNKNNLTVTRDGLLQALGDAPANLELRRSLVATYRKLGDQGGVVSQQAMIEHLKAGTP